MLVESSILPTLLSTSDEIVSICDKAIAEEEGGKVNVKALKIIKDFLYFKLKLLLKI